MVLDIVYYKVKMTKLLGATHQVSCAPLHRSFRLLLAALVCKAASQDAAAYEYFCQSATNPFFPILVLQTKTSYSKILPIKETVVFSQQHLFFGHRSTCMEDCMGSIIFDILGDLSHRYFLQVIDILVSYGYILFLTFSEDENPKEIKRVKL